MDRRIVRWGLLTVLLITVTFGRTIWAKSIFSRSPSRPAQSARSPQSAPPIQWFHDLKTAHRASASSGRPMLVVFGGPKCFYCRKLENEVFTIPELADSINRAFVPVHLDFERNRKAAEILEVHSLPTSVVLSPDADLLGEVEGFVEAPKFAAALREALEYHRALQAERELAARDAK